MNYLVPQRATPTQVQVRVVFKTPVKASRGLVIRRSPLTKVAHGPIKYVAEHDRTGQEFSQLRDRWQSETRRLSSIDRKILNDSYQRIIGMGERALPHIFRALRTRTEFWFPALYSITGEDPVPPEAAGDLDAMREHWLRWAEENGHSGS